MDDRPHRADRADDARGVIRVRVGTGIGTVRMELLERYNAAKLPASKFIEVGMPMRVVHRIKELDKVRNSPRYFWKATPLQA